MSLFDEMDQMETKIAKHPELAVSAAEFKKAIAAVRETTQWIFANATNQTAVLSGATPYLRQLSTLVGGYMMAKSAHVAVHAEMPENEKAARVSSARFFCEQLLPAVHGLSGAVMGDDELLMSFDEKTLAV
jgi:pyruvate-formate lyase